VSAPDYRLLTLEQAAKLLGLRWTNVRELVETGQLRAVRIGTRYRVPAAALAELGRLAGGAPYGAPYGRRDEDAPGRNGRSNGPVFPINRRRPDGGG
jgi:excisionase family DNA binding protein